MGAEQVATAVEVQVEVGVRVDAGVEVVEVRGAGGLEAFLRVGADPRLYRIAPARDPRQPRFWCLVAVECSPTGLPETGQPIWAGAWETKREELPTVLGAIRADVRGWLAETPQAALRRRLDAPRPPTAPLGTPQAAASRSVGQQGQAGGVRAGNPAPAAPVADPVPPLVANDAAGTGQSS